MAMSGLILLLGRCRVLQSTQSHLTHRHPRYLDEGSATSLDALYPTGVSDCNFIIRRGVRRKVSFVINPHVQSTGPMCAEIGSSLLSFAGNLFSSY